MALLSLSQDRATRVDDEDYEQISRWRWHFLSNDRSGYAVRQVTTPRGVVTIYLHRFLLAAQPHELVDHVDGDGLNNLRSNLRCATPSENAANRPTPPRAIPYRGVYRDRRRRSYFAQIRVSGQARRLGTFATAEAAAKAYDQAAALAFGRFARLNFPDEAAVAALQLALPWEELSPDTRYPRRRSVPRAARARAGSL